MTRGRSCCNRSYCKTLRKVQVAAVALFGPLADDYPRHHLYLKELAVTLNSLGIVEALDKNDDARTAWRRAKGIGRS